MAFQLSLFRLLGIRTSGLKRALTKTKKKSIRRQVSKRRSPAAIEDQELKSIWLRLRADYFPDRADLDNYVLRWSPRRQKRTLASCALEKRIVSVAQEMRSENCKIWLEPLIYHELCHAVLGHEVGRESGKRQWHGQAFRKLEKRHPQIPALDTWIRAGGWTSAVRSHRSRAAHAARKSISLTHP